MYKWVMSLEQHFCWPLDYMRNRSSGKSLRNKMKKMAKVSSFAALAKSSSKSVTKLKTLFIINQPIVFKINGKQCFSVSDSLELFAARPQNASVSKQRS